MLKTDAEHRDELRIHHSLQVVKRHEQAAVFKHIMAVVDAFHFDPLAIHGKLVADLQARIRSQCPADDRLFMISRGQ